MLTVNKRDGDREPFNIDKLINSMTKAGVPLDKAEELSSGIVSWVEENKANDMISSASIREQVIQALRNDFPLEADNYESHSKI